MQAEMAKGAEDSSNLAMGKRTEELKGQLAGDQILTLQDAAQEIDLRRGPGGEIGEGAFVDLGADADGKALGHYKMAKHFHYRIRSNRFTYERNQASIEPEAALAGSM